MAEPRCPNEKWCQPKQPDLTSHPEQVFSCETDPLEIHNWPNCTLSNHSLMDFCKDHKTANFPTYSCQKCGNFTTHSSRTFEEHQITCTPKISREHKCQHCNNVTESFDAKIFHILNYHTAPDDFTVFDCPQCGGQTKLTTSNDIFADINDSKCKFCTKPQSAIERGRLGENAGCDFAQGEWFLKKFNSRTWFECDQCTFQAKSKKGLTCHMTGKHYKPSHVRCVFCNYLARYSWRLKKHVRKVHVNNDSVTNWDHNYALTVTLP